MSKSGNIGKKSASELKSRRKKTPSTKELMDGILRGDQPMLARAITLVESTNPEHQEKAYKIIERSLSHKNDTLRIGITGVPGVGKSTFIESFGSMLTGMGKKVAVLAVDPTSTVSKGSILGDKTRMPHLVNDPNAFIRPSPSGESLGGVARKTRESIILCEAAGYDVILVETVGVGQSETAVHSMVDFFLLLKLSGAGDELQGIKRGIMEMADAIVINKAEGDNIKRAERARSEFERALHLYPPKESNWSPKVLTCSSLNGSGIPEIWQMVNAFAIQSKGSGYFKSNRQDQNTYWFHQTVESLLQRQFYHQSSVKKAMAPLQKAVEELRISPFRAAEQLLEAYSKGLK
ncbi:methylmalonyl Co-A mutase-associated GTPase MeaB [Muriicola sp. E247]|uniref:methylmalonyl Co-A mutase-associated GTPase MeaB n=1 Tax=Muriicola sp. E247 TaxID=3242730 RepID=UPI0035255E8B